MYIYNEDGTPYDPPVDPEYQKLIIDDCIPRGRDPYMCIFCGQCPLGDNFTPTEEQKVIIDRHNALVESYIKLHNPTKGLNGIIILHNAAE